MVSDLILPPGATPPARPNPSAAVRFDCYPDGKIKPMRAGDADPRFDLGAQNAEAIIRLVYCVMCAATPKEVRLVKRLLDRIDARIEQNKGTTEK